LQSVEILQNGTVVAGS